MIGSSKTHTETEAEKCLNANNTLWTEKKNVFLIYSLQNLTNCDKILYTLSRVNLSYRNVDVLRLT